ncbi:HemK/PrmC family methyltransferase [Streptomyces sp. NPDC049585]|uniref:N5-glutamine methyltransferase family protein n=1 Tax=Streptomyces sp. NPDC049585 TaxID=3155154 RepID=UPI003441269B
MVAGTLKAHIEDAVEVMQRTGAVMVPRGEAEVLAAHVFGVPVAELALDGEPDEESLARYRALVHRRSEGVPLGYLTGSASLSGVEVEVGPGVFVPLIVSEAVVAAGLGAIAELPAPLVVDLCAGSGAFALAVAHHAPGATVHAVEHDPDALAYARRNRARRAALGDRPVELHQGDVTLPATLAELNGTVDLVLSSPPYQPQEAAVPDEFGVHQPREAVFGGPDGLHVTRHVVEAAARLLRPGGTLVLEHGHQHGETVPALLRADGRFTDVSEHPDAYMSYPLYALARRAAP